MSNAPLHKCAAAGCRALVRNQPRCEAHTDSSRHLAQNRPGDPFYTSTPWRNLRAQYLADNPLCMECGRNGRVTAANEVHHVKPRKQHPELAYEWDNLESLCKSCHSRETNRERAMG